MGQYYWKGGSTLAAGTVQSPVTTTHTAVCVMTTGTTWMPVLSVTNSESQEMVRVAEG